MGQPIEFNDLLAELLRTGCSEGLLLAGDYPFFIRPDGTSMRVREEKTPREHVKELLDVLLSPHQKEQFRKENTIELTWAVPRLGRFRVWVSQSCGSLLFRFKNLPIHSRRLQDYEIFDTLQLVIETNREKVILLFGDSSVDLMFHSIVDYVNENYDFQIGILTKGVTCLHRNKKSRVLQYEQGYDYANARTMARPSFPFDVICYQDLNEYEHVAMLFESSFRSQLVLATIGARTTVAALSRIVQIFPPHQQLAIRHLLSDSLSAVFGVKGLLDRNEAVRHIHEVFISNPEARSIIASGDSTLASLESLIESGKEGMFSFDQNIDRLISRKEIGLVEGIRHATKKAAFVDKYGLTRDSLFGKGREDFQTSSPGESTD